MKRRRQAAVAGGLVLIGVAAVSGWALFDGSAAGPEPAATAPATATAPVTRTDVAQRSPANGTLGHAGGYDLVAAGQGTITRLPAVGQVVKRGDAAYEVDGRRVPLLYGTRAVWRTFRLGMSDGSDVRQLETNLTALGYGDALTVDGHFSYATYWAVRRWQDDAHLPVTGTVPLGRIVFAPGAVRITGRDVKAGTPVHPGLLVVHGSSDRRVVTVQLSPADTPKVHVGDDAIVTLPDGTSRRGTVTAVSAVASSSNGDSGASGGSPGGGSSGGSSGGGSPSVVPATVTVDGALHGYLDQAQVQVQITSDEHKNVLAVPIVALRALPGGRYEVVVVDGATRRHVPVETGLFDETNGVAEVSGAGLTEGAHVEVPGAGS
ncbi:peptidoglycan-binding protein [Actinoallomurus oryzae]|uniref:Peptidoglycan-binding protein n=1 Tax=Actinoallomurus oryzae TaxID=502180 RepID=A0ABP8QPF9_9ACTN